MAIESVGVFLYEVMEKSKWTFWPVHDFLLICILCMSYLNKGFPGGSAGKESACNVGDLGSIPGLGRSPGEWKGYPLQYSGLENSLDCIVHGVAKSQTWLSDFHFILIERRSPSLQADTWRSEPPGKPVYGTDIGQFDLPYWPQFFWNAHTLVKIQSETYIFFLKLFEI